MDICESISKFLDRWIIVKVLYTFFLLTTILTLANLSINIGNQGSLIILLAILYWPNATRVIVLDVAELVLLWEDMFFLIQYVMYGFISTEYGTNQSVLR